MRTTFRVALAGTLILAGVSHAQVGAVLQPDGSPSQFLLVPEGGPGAAPPPLFLGQGAGGQLFQGSGTVNNLSVNSLGTLQVGFSYLRPLWSFRDFLLTVPAAAAGNFPLLGDTGHVDNHFAFAPVVDYHYQFANSLYGVGVSGTFLSLSGQLHRQVGSTLAGLGDLNANSQLTIVEANLLEFTRALTLGDDGDGGGKKKGGVSWFDDLDVNLSIGSRYSSISQNYTGSLTSAATLGATAATNASTRYSSQSFQGFGLTTAATLSLPVSDAWILFSSTRASVAIGDNRKDSTLTVNVAGLPGVSTTINQTKTSFVPIIESEVGAEWGTLVGRRARPEDVPALLTLRVAAIGQFWGGVGPLSAGSTQGFRQSDLFLLGVNVMVGFRR